eukprot:gene3573-732_t
MLREGATASEYTEDAVVRVWTRETGALEIFRGAERIAVWLRRRHRLAEKGLHAAAEEVDVRTGTPAHSVRLWCSAADGFAAAADVCIFSNQMRIE